MIVKMHKYTFWVYHKEYEDFLEPIQQLGILHVVENNKIISEEINQKQAKINQIEKTIQFLNRRGIEPDRENQNLDAEKVILDITSKQKELIEIEQALAEARKKHKIIKLWGDFSFETIQKLEKENFYVKFFIASKKKFDYNLLSEYNAEIINENRNKIYFIIIQKGNNQLNINAEEITLPNYSYTEIKNCINKLENKILLIENDFDIYAKAAIPLLTKEKDALAAGLEYKKTILNTDSEADTKVKILEGWVPETKKKQIDHFLNKTDFFHVVEEGTEKDSIPVLMKNNRFSKLFEPIGKLFSLPAYTELDLTLFFAPFFMLFFGFCLGDAGYGLLFVLGAGLYKLKAKKEFKPILSLLQYLGIATVFFGVLTGTFFGINLIETEIGFLADYKQLFFNPDKMFNMALILGAVQIVFAMFLRAANQIKQHGFMHSLSTFGWLIVILVGGIYTALTKLETIPVNNSILYAILSLGGFFIIFFSDVNVNIFTRIGKGVWDIYSTVTGIFGDILSYIRLFALGLSSAILGFVINDIAIQILGSSKILGSIFFIIFLLLGHTLNILIASLGSFVHPMRLTFVEFYKNAGFKGGGKEYRPFRK